MYKQIELEMSRTSGGAEAVRYEITTLHGILFNDVSAESSSTDQ